MREAIAAIAATFGWSLAEIKRMPLGELQAWARLAPRFFRPLIG